MIAIKDEPNQNKIDCCTYAISLLAFVQFPWARIGNDRFYLEFFHFKAVVSVDSRIRETRRPIGIDLFAGAGGLSLGFEQAGIDIAAAVEIDPIHCATHAFNFPDCATICSSVVEVTGQEIRDRVGELAGEIDPSQRTFSNAVC